MPPPYPSIPVFIQLLHTGGKRQHAPLSSYNRQVPAVVPHCGKDWKIEKHLLI
jgi:hypothetical protein